MTFKFFIDLSRTVEVITTDRVGKREGKAVRELALQLNTQVSIPAGHTLLPRTHF